MRRRTLLQAALSPALPSVGDAATAETAAASPTWRFDDKIPLRIQADTTVVLATDVPARAVAYASPDLLPGQSLVINGSTLELRNDATVPATDHNRPTVITVLDGELATAQNMRTGTMYGPTQSGPRRNIQFAMVEAQDGDTLQVSPGAIWSPGVGDGSSYLEGAMLHVWKSVTITNIPGKGRWRLAPSSMPFVDGLSGIVIREPGQTYSNTGDTNTSEPRKTIIVQGFDFDNWGRQAGDYGVRIRAGSGTGRWANIHASVTLRDFKVGKRPYYPSASGIAGSAEHLVFENGHVYDTGNAIHAGDGQDHNFYVSARKLEFIGVRGSRSRASAATDMDGHIFKTAAADTLFEGCVIDCGPRGDNSYNIQCRAGGNVTIRGCLLIGGLHTQNQSTGVIGYENEITQTPWFYGAEGHSVLIEKNVIVNHYGKPLVFFRPAGHAWQVRGVRSVAIRDNIGMCAATPTAMAGFGESMWILNDPLRGPAWPVQNSVMRYGLDEPGFDDKALKRYTRTAGPIAAAGAAVATRRFVWPHGWVARSDNHRGLG